MTTAFPVARLVSETTCKVQYFIVNQSVLNWATIIRNFPIKGWYILLVAEGKNEGNGAVCETVIL